MEPLHQQLIDLQYRILCTICDELDDKLITLSEVKLADVTQAGIIAANLAYTELRDTLSALKDARHALSRIATP